MVPASKTGLAGTRPPGASDDAAAAQQVRDMFDRIAPRYDFLNHLLSLDFDKRWRRETARRFQSILADRHAAVLDLCCGTGDLAFALEGESLDKNAARGRGAHILASDFSHSMLVLGREKAAAAGSRVEFIEADALQLPLADARFDLVTAAFGFRNLANYFLGLREIRRVLKPSGWAGILEFAEPRGKIFGTMYRFYFSRILPRLGGLISGSSAAYSYLPNSVEKFPRPEEVAALFESAGFSEVRFELWMGGIVTLHTGRRT